MNSLEANLILLIDHARTLSASFEENLSSSWRFEWKSENGEVSLDRIITETVIWMEIRWQISRIRLESYVDAVIRRNGRTLAPDTVGFERERLSKTTCTRFQLVFPSVIRWRGFEAWRTQISRSGWPSFSSRHGESSQSTGHWVTRLLIRSATIG